MATVKLTTEGFKKKVFDYTKGLPKSALEEIIEKELVAETVK